MILVFITSLLLEIFTTSFVVLVVAYDFNIEIENTYDFFMFHSLLIILSIIAIYVESLITNRGDQFVAYIYGKYAFQCDDKTSNQKVNFMKKIVLFFTFYSFSKIITLLMKTSGCRKPMLHCGFFNIDLRLGFSIVATIATYIVIIAQFEKEFEKNINQVILDYLLLLFGSYKFIIFNYFFNN